MEELTNTYLLDINAMTEGLVIRYLPLPRQISRLTSHARINVMGSVCTPVHALMYETTSNYIQDSFLHTSICYFSFLKAAKD